MLTVYNTLTRKPEIFEPIRPPFVGMYVCGPTVYDEPHLGHGKSYVSFDVVVRFLRALGYKVRYVQNITDVGHLLGDEQEGEDRILKKARLEQLEPIEVAQKYERHFFRDMDKLNCLRPDISCRATGHIPEMVDLVKMLVDKGFAYESDGNVYFDVARFAEYGKLSGKRLEDLKEGVRIDVAEGKHHPFDFALWKKADAGHLMQWSSPWGKGFPGWHLECSVMSMKYLGEHFDIHGGGLDNQFPHHECEIAQSEAATGKPFAKVWLHNNMVTVNGQKMSKSLGNFVTLDELFGKYDPMTCRFFVLQGHYRSPQDFSPEALDAAQRGFARLARTVLALRERIAFEPDLPELPDPRWDTFARRFHACLEDDFNTAGGISVLFDLVKESNERLTAGSDAGSLRPAERLFSRLGEEILGFLFTPAGQGGAGPGMEKGLLDFMVALRTRLRAQKHWTLADEIRDILGRFGVSVEDGKDGSRWVKKWNAGGAEATDPHGSGAAK